METIIKWVAMVVMYIYIGVIFMLVDITSVKRPPCFNKRRIIIAWLPAIFITKVKRWVNSKKSSYE